MKFILMMNTMKASTPAFAGWSQEDIKRHIEFMIGFAKQLRESKELLSAEGLAFPHEAKQVRASASGEPSIDGPFAETKEFLAGFWIVQVDTPQRAYAIAAEASAAPGIHGAPLNMPIEVRQIMSGPPEV